MIKKRLCEKAPAKCFLPFVSGGKHGSPKPNHDGGGGGNSSSGRGPKARTNNKIMLVDDDEDVLFTFKTLLQSEGWDIDAFANPHEALWQYEKDALMVL